MPHEHKTEYHLVVVCGGKQGQTPDSEILVVRNGYQIKYLSLKRFRMPGCQALGRMHIWGFRLPAQAKGCLSFIHHIFNDSHEANNFETAD